MLFQLLSQIVFLLSQIRGLAGNDALTELFFLESRQNNLGIAREVLNHDGCPAYGDEGVLSVNALLVFEEFFQRFTSID